MITRYKTHSFFQQEFLEDNKEHVVRVKESLYYDNLLTGDDGADYDNYVNMYDEYDDEYDDTYDSVDVAAVDTDNVDELSTRR